MSQNRKANAATASKAAETAPPATVETPADQGDAAPEVGPETPDAPVEETAPSSDETPEAPQADLTDGCNAEHSPGSNPDCDVAPAAVEAGSPAQLDGTLEAEGTIDTTTEGAAPQDATASIEESPAETEPGVAPDDDPATLTDEEAAAYAEALKAEAAAAAQTEAPSPASAVIDPPPEPPLEEKPLVIPDTVNEAAAERLRVTEAQVTIRDPRGNQLDPDAVFSAKGPDGLRRCLVRLIQHSTETLYDRHIETLLLPAGAYVGPDSAETIIETIRAERA